MNRLRGRVNKYGIGATGITDQAFWDQCIMSSM